MPDDSTTDTGDKSGAAGADDQQREQAGGNSGSSKTYSQDEFNALDKKLRREYESKYTPLKKKAEAWDQYEQSKKSQEEQLQEKYANLEREHNALKTSMDLEKARIKCGRKFNIPEADWDRLRGATPDEIEQDAKDWAKSRGLDKAGGPTPKGNNNAARNPFNQAFLDATGRGGR